MTREEFSDLMVALSEKLRAAYAADTSVAPEDWSIYNPAAGHCAVTAVVIWRLYSGWFVSTRIAEQSHWFNRVNLYGNNEDWVDVDLTGDQFGRRPIQVEPVGALYPDCRLRTLIDLRQETLERANLLWTRAGLDL